MKSIFALIFLGLFVQASADGRDWCGDFKEVTFKPQTFRVVSSDGFVFPELLVKPTAGAVEAIWNGEDWFSAEEFHPTSTKISYDEKTGLYTVAEFKIKPKARWKPLAGCKDTVVPLTFEANWGKREEGVNLKYHRGWIRLSLSAYKGQKKPVVASNPEPHAVVLEKRDIIEGRIISRPQNYWYEVETGDGKRYQVGAATLERSEEQVILRNAWENNKAVRLHGKVIEGEDVTRFWFDYVDVL